MGWSLRTERWPLFFFFADEKKKNDGTETAERPRHRHFLRLVSAFAGTFDGLWKRAFEWIRHDYVFGGYRQQVWLSRLNEPF